MRTDRILSLAFARFVRERPFTGRTVILMYHGVNDRGEMRERIHPYFKTVTSPFRFAQHLRWLSEMNADVIALDNWATPPESGNGPRVVLTFDDALDDFGTNAYPVLREYAYPATVFVPTAFIESPARIIDGQEHLRWKDMERLAATGKVAFGSHTVNHRYLGDLAPGQIRDEVAVSADTIKGHLGTNVTLFACPFAFPDAQPHIVATLRGSLRECGYHVGVTTRIGTVRASDDPYILRRIPVNDSDDKPLFVAKLTGAYDWLYGAQFLLKRFKQALRVHHSMGT